MAARIRLFVKLWPLLLSGALLLFTAAVCIDIALGEKKSSDMAGELRAIKLELRRIGNSGLPKGDSEVVPINPPAKE